MYKVCRAGDIVFNKMSIRAGALGVAAEDGLVTYHYEVMRPLPDNDARFIVYLMKSTSFIAELIARERGIGSGDQTNVRTTEVPFSVLKTIDAFIPTMEQQRAIADFLDRETAKIDALIAKQEQLIATLREDRIATITHAVTKGLDPDVEMVDSGIPWLGQIPSHWTLGKVKHGFSVVLGKMYQGARQSSNDQLLPHLKAGSLNEALELDLDDPMLCWFTPEEMRKLSVRKDDLLVVEGGATYGRCAIVREDLPGWGFQKSLNRVRARGDDSIRFLAYLIRSATEIGHVSILCGKATIPHFTAEKLESLEWPHPKPVEQQEIVSFLEDRCASINALIAKAEEVIRTLREYRSALVTDAVTGKIDVRGAA
ncbi:restriction endonuclease subunit S [Mycobacterium sp. HNNTM2301]|uniref:restriction endonuclease subunit S n=1 Tax=Mycobacterium hainanense TaxID=3289775 RepID=UPI0035A5CED2